MNAKFQGSSNFLIYILVTSLIAFKICVFCQQTISIGDTGVTLATMNNTIPASNFSCGANRFTEFIPQLFNSTECKNLRDPMNVCCETHDNCYNTQIGKDFCDNEFCLCLSTATEKNLCAVDAAGFCAAVRLFGETAYNTLGGLEPVSPTIN
ncbi:uncharacterized protein CELE_B0478.3 [Caenorhabditis elegans]|uniref:Uncharacterized protein n=1 Tax=Caenorhabditis elegans TaxID=6239 RepID=Q17508_CAEEL|nr:Uncharacterized protein CELE_B0478.3 [Caenorhabditis elegans]CCD62006.1 Uncharacterized protein CELE_B0478.3 [Caenorhabditis elegans]|eukprot:NP_501074.1 Uncharacterized protein CELE_B0478.3 [Caenorhabditis elegans]